MSTLLYTQYRSIQLALTRVDTSDEPFEHHVGTVVNSLLHLYFPNGTWTITPEKIQPDRKRPDFVVERIENNASLQPHLFVEIKKKGGDSFAAAMRQAGDATVEVLDEMGVQNSNFATFVVVVRGMEIGFFEYYNYRELLDDEDISNYEGLISLTQPIPQQRSSYQLPALTNFIASLPQGLKKPMGRGNSILYGTPCIFHLQSHVGLVGWMFEYISRNIPREHIGEYILLSKINFTNILQRIDNFCWTKSGVDNLLFFNWLLICS